MLFAPMNSNNVYLIDKCGRSVHKWNGTRRPGLSAYLLEDGSLLRTECVNNLNFAIGGNGGGIARYDWSNNPVWSYIISSDSECQHHDIRRLPNGNILAIVWERKTVAQAVDAGRDPALLGTELWSEKIVELQPFGKDGANIVWEWHVWDHLVQDFDQGKANYNIVRNNPGLINLNFYGDGLPSADWLHINSIDYNPALDQIILSVHSFSEIWIIDHSTTSAEASGHAGGRYNHGGDLLYRWGNPAAYDRGTSIDQKLFGQHNARWITGPRTDSGKIMMFNNGLRRPGQAYSTVDVIDQPVLASGAYQLNGSAPYGPTKLFWQYKDPTPTRFYSPFISGAQPLTNGNVLICEGDDGRFFEVDQSGNIVWEYINPIAMSALSQGAVPNGMTNAFRCTQYLAGYQGFVGRTLSAGAPLEINPLSYTCKMGSGGTGGGGGGGGGGGSTAVTTLEGNGRAVVVANPFYEELQLQSGQPIHGASLQLTDLAGRVCQRWSNVDFSVGGTLHLNLTAGLSPGVYLLHITSPDYKQVIKLMH